MTLYHNFRAAAVYAVLTIPIWVPLTVGGVKAVQSKRIDGYSVSQTNIGRCDDHGLTCTYWSDSNGDGQFDTKQRATLMPPARSPSLVVDVPFGESDRRLTDSLVARLK